MDGFWGLVGGKMSPANGSGTVLMDEPQTQQISWSYNYIIPVVIFVVILLLIIGLVTFLVFFRRSGARTTPAASG